ncbi:MAG TPA: AmmeMemoRadiSam system protein B [Thermoplasmata archaeon]|nr:AmmeMemoRadiSam system protein B [Thermoplasmata archaeon]
MPTTPRSPAVAGQFYEGDGAALAHQLESCFTDARGPGTLPTRQRSADRTVRAAVVPHAGYVFSGPIAAHAYRLIAADRPPESVLVLGVDHYGASQGASLSERPWLTPLGPTPVDLKLLAALRKPPVNVDEEAHRREHSIEVQLPFLEYVLPHPRFVPLEVGYGPYEFLAEVAGVVRSAIQDRDVLVIASTDFSHYVPAATAERLDRMAIDQILARDPRGLYDTVRRNDISMCGIAPTTVLLAALEGLDVRPRLLRWGHSGEVEKMRDVVGYASMVFESPAERSPVK